MTERDSGTSPLGVAGQQVGDYVLERRLGSGGQGEVWVGIPVTGGNRVAIKLLRSWSYSERELQLFHREARAGEGLNHRGLVRILSYDLTGETPYLVQELVGEGRTLGDFIEQTRQLDEVSPAHDRHVAEMFLDLAEALDVAHRAHVIHRDVKPSNILLSEDSHPRVTDFGLAKISGESSVSVTGELQGTYLYMSPEQSLAGRVPLDHRTDIFSLGSSFFEALTLRPAFAANTTKEIVDRVNFYDPIAPRALRASIPPALEGICARMLEKRPRDRYESMADVAEDLRRFLAGKALVEREPHALGRAWLAAAEDRQRSTAAATETVSVRVAELAKPGDVIAGRYEVLGLLGEGGMGVVYRVRDRHLLCTSALKRIRVDGSEVMERFLREGQSSAALNHENIRAVKDIAHDEAGPFLVMEYIEGETLHELVSREGALPESKLLVIGRGLARALAHAHRRRILHRDVKPLNVLINEEGVPKLTDFGLARNQHDSDLSRSGVGMGTSSYASPEQKRNARAVDHRSDIYSLGATLYFAATSESPRTIRESRIPARWRALILKCLEERPESRHFSADEVLLEMESLPGSRGPATPTPSWASGSGRACPSCEAINAEDRRYCNRCGGGLFKACPGCTFEERVEAPYCGRCGLDLVGWRASDEHLLAAREHLAAQDYGHAVRELEAALKRAPKRSELHAELSSARAAHDTLERARGEARALEGDGDQDLALGAWARVVGLVPNDAEARSQLARLTELVRRRRFDLLLREIETSLSKGDVQAARAQLARLWAESLASESAEVDAAEAAIEARLERLKQKARLRFARSTEPPFSLGEAEGALALLQKWEEDPAALAACRQRIDVLNCEIALDGALTAADWDTVLLEVRERFELANEAASENDTREAGGLARRAFVAALAAGHLAVARAVLTAIKTSAGEAGPPADFAELRLQYWRQRRRRWVRRAAIAAALLVGLAGAAGAGLFLRDRGRIEAALSELAAGKAELALGLDHDLWLPADLMPSQRKLALNLRDLADSLRGENGAAGSLHDLAAGSMRLSDAAFERAANQLVTLREEFTAPHLGDALATIATVLEHEYTAAQFVLLPSVLWVHPGGLIADWGAKPAGVLSVSVIAETAEAAGESMESPDSRLETQAFQYDGISGWRGAPLPESTRGRLASLRHPTGLIANFGASGAHDRQVEIRVTKEPPDRWDEVPRDVLLDALQRPVSLAGLAGDLAKARVLQAAAAVLRERGAGVPEEYDRFRLLLESWLPLPGSSVTPRVAESAAAVTAEIEGAWEALARVKESHSTFKLIPGRSYAEDRGRRLPAALWHRAAALEFAYVNAKSWHSASSGSQAGPVEGFYIAVSDVELKGATSPEAWCEKHGLQLPNELQRSLAGESLGEVIPARSRRSDTRFRPVWHLPLELHEPVPAMVIELSAQLPDKRPQSSWLLAEQSLSGRVRNVPRSDLSIGLLFGEQPRSGQRLSETLQASQSLSADGSFSLPWPLLRTGQYSAHLVVIDRSGTSMAAATQSLDGEELSGIQVFVDDDPPPTPQLVEQLPKSTGEEVVFVQVRTDPSAPEEGLQYILQDESGAEIDKQSADGNGQATLEWPLDRRSESFDLSAQVVALDEAGNSSSPLALGLRVDRRELRVEEVLIEGSTALWSEPWALPRTGSTYWLPKNYPGTDQLTVRVLLTHPNMGHRLVLEGTPDQVCEWSTEQEARFKLPLDRVAMNLAGELHNSIRLLTPDDEVLQRKTLIVRVDRESPSIELDGASIHGQRRLRLPGLSVSDKGSGLQELQVTHLGKGISRRSLVGLDQFSDPVEVLLECECDVCELFVEVSDRVGNSKTQLHRVHVDDAPPMATDILLRTLPSGEVRRQIRPGERELVAWVEAAADDAPSSGVELLLNEEASPETAALRLASREPWQRQLMVVPRSVPVGEDARVELPKLKLRDRSGNTATYTISIDLLTTVAEDVGQIGSGALSLAWNAGRLVALTGRRDELDGFIGGVGSMTLGESTLLPHLQLPTLSGFLWKSKSVATSANLDRHGRYVSVILRKGPVEIFAVDASGTMLPEASAAEPMAILPFDEPDRPSAVALSRNAEGRMVVTCSGGGGLSQWVSEAPPPSIKKWKRALQRDDPAQMLSSSEGGEFVAALTSADLLLIVQGSVVESRAIELASESDPFLVADPLGRFALLADGLGVVHVATAASHVAPRVNVPSGRILAAAFAPCGEHAALSIAAAGIVIFDGLSKPEGLRPVGVVGEAEALFPAICFAESDDHQGGMRLLASQSDGRLRAWRLPVQCGRGPGH